MEPFVVSAVEAARLMAISRTTVYVLMASGELESFTAGRKRLITVESIRTWIARKTQEAKA